MPRNPDGSFGTTGISVTMREGQRFRCQNKECGCEIVVTRTSREGDFPPKCCCGAAMKKPYHPPTLRTLDANDQRSSAVKELVKK